MRRSSSFEVRRARPLLGTFVEITVGGVSEPEANRAIDDAFHAIEEVQRCMSFHEPESTLSELNRRAAREPVTVDKWTYVVLQTAVEIHRVSGGVFDVTIAPRLQQLGFLPGPPPLNSDSRPASLADVELLPDHRVRFHHPDVRIDLGGIAKGFAVDCAITALRASRIPRALVNAGGDLRAYGGDGFPVHLRHPENPGDTFAPLTVRDCALATSAHTFADRIAAGETFGPIIHPATGERATQVRSATVRARTAMLSDALTKVVMLSGEASLPILEHFDADAIFIATANRVLCSPRWHAAFHLPT